MIQIKRIKLTRIYSWPYGEGCDIPYFVLLQIIIQMAIDPRAIEVVRSDREASWEEKIFPSGGWSLC